MTKQYSIAAARQNLAAIVHELEAQPIIELTRRGAPVAVLVSIDAYQRLTHAQRSFWATYTAYRTTLDPALLDHELDPFSAVRDSSPGREVEL